MSSVRAREARRLSCAHLALERLRQGRPLVMDCAGPVFGDTSGVSQQAFWSVRLKWPEKA